MSITASTTLSFLRAVVFVACGLIIVRSSSARADISSLPYGGGGIGINQIDGVIAQLNQKRELFRIEGNCRSSCTELLAVKNMCVDPGATLQFHAALLRPNLPVDPARNLRMASHYNSKLRSFVLTNHYLDSWEFHSISGQDIIQKFGYRQCPAR